VQEGAAQSLGEIGALALELLIGGRCARNEMEA